MHAIHMQALWESLKSDDNVKATPSPSFHLLEAPWAELAADMITEQGKMLRIVQLQYEVM
jgi:hypothetical protein